MAAVTGTTIDIWNVQFEDISSIIFKLIQEEIKPIGITLILIGVILGPLTVVANSIVITAIWKDPFKDLRSVPSNLIIASMACSDLLVGMICGVFSVLVVSGVSSNTRVQQGFLVTILTFIGLSVCHAFGLTLDRLIAVTRPLRYRAYVTKKRVSYCILGIWIITLLSTLIKVPLSNFYYIFSLGVFILFNVMILATSIMSMLIIYRVHKSSPVLSNTHTGGQDNSKLNSRNRKATKSILLIVAIFKASFAPFSICWMIVLTCGECRTNLKALLIAYCFSTYIMIFNSCLNPFVYAFRLPKFKRPIIHIIKKILCLKKSPLNESHRNSKEQGTASNHNEGINSIQQEHNV